MRTAYQSERELRQLVANIIETIFYTGLFKQKTNFNGNCKVIIKFLPIIRLGIKDLKKRLT